MSELVYCSARRLAALIRNGEVSCLDVAEAHFRRIEEVNPRLNAVVQFDPALLRKQALAAQASTGRREVCGPLHGVPFTVKDSLETAGLATTSGNLGRAAFVPQADATAVARLRAAGGLLLGKTNVPDLTFAYETDNLVYGRTNNPYDLSRTPGGSCGGEAAIIAAGGSPLGIGSDLGGSLRYPAHFCGIASLKPTARRIPRTGHFPPAAGILEALWHVGPLARFVEDLELALPLLAGPDGRDSSVESRPLREANSVVLNELRVAFYTDNGLHPPTPETRAAVTEAVRALSTACADVAEAQPRELTPAYVLPWKILGADGGAGLRELLAAIGCDRVHPYLETLLERLRLAPLSAAELGEAVSQLEDARAAMSTFWDSYEVLICPVCAFPAPPHGQAVGEEAMLGFSYTVPYNVTGWPVVAVRAGESADGLPIGLQVISPPWREDIALAVAGFIEKTFGGWKPPPL